LTTILTTIGPPLPAEDGAEHGNGLRDTSGATWPQTSPVIAIDEWPRISETP